MYALERLMRCALFSLALGGLAACGGDAVPSTSEATSVSASASATDTVEGSRIAADPAVRQRLSPPELLRYFPATLEGREPNLDGRYLYDDTGAMGWSRVSVQYRMPSGLQELVEINIIDFIDDPEGMEPDRARVQDGQGIDTYATGEVSDVHTLAGGVGRDYTPQSGGGPELYVLLADRFFLNFRAESSDMEPDALWSLYNASGLGRLAGAPAHDELGAAAVPAWATSAVAEWETTVVSQTSEPPETVAEIPSLPPCDEVLPVTEVERVCDVTGVQVYPTAFIEEGATSCNRRYAIPGNLSGLELTISRYDDATRALAGQGVAAEVENPRDLRDVAGLGDAATRYIRDSEAAQTSTRVLVLAASIDLIEMRSTVLPDEPSAGVCTLDQLETLARGVTERLGN